MATPTRSHTFVDGDTLTGGQLNTEFNNLLNAPAIANADVASNTAIASSKLSFGGTSGQFLKSAGDGTLTYNTVAFHRAFGFYITGNVLVANDLSWNPMVPENMTAIKIWASVKTPPTGSSMIIRVAKTDSTVIGSVTVGIGAFSGNSTSFTTPALNQGEVLEVDCTQAGSTIPGGDVSIILECSEP